MRMRMHGWRAGEEERKREGRRRHMWTVPPRGSSILASVADGGSASPSSSSLSSSPNSFSFFCKDGRKISVGDCALFKPPQDSPPFIGIIRSLTAGKENKLTLSVNWLYRPAEVKLGKGFLLEAAPNEIFYSFHKDEIPAASLLHPCKVAFLPKGVELPSGIGSFVCRKVYDITNKCLWWLTDQDYINERQEEVDQLLYKTRIEMHATVPSGGRSPKPMNGPTSTSQLKPGSDGVQNSASFPSQVKGKKRERGDQSSEPVKRERSSKMEDGDSGHSRTESNLKTEIAKITEKGGLVDYDGVEKLVQLMVPEKNEKKIDLVCRSMLAGVVAATDKFDCLNRFVQLRGLPVFDEWLQEVHKGKIGDVSSPKDGDKSVEEFLLILLRALDKLPVNLNALQMCNIGKSVNHLRTHKNLEIQKKARSLVDTWKKRVEAEMDAKSGSNQPVSWPARPRLPEVAHGGNRQTSGSSEVAIKSLVTQPVASKPVSVKVVQGDTPTKSAFSSPVSVKSAPISASGSANPKDVQPRNAAGAADLPSTPARDEKSSSSSQSHNNGQSCSGEQAKTGGFSGKDDARSSASVSMTLNKTPVGSSRSRKSANGFPGSTVSGTQRETGSSKNSSLHRNSASERASQSVVTCEKALDIPVAEGSNHKLIVKIPNRGRSPAQNASGGSVEDPPVTNSRTSSPVLSEKQNYIDRNFKEKSDAFRADTSSNVNSESWQSNDNKDALACPDEGSGSPAVVSDDQGCKPGDNSRKMVDISEDTSVPPGYEQPEYEFKDEKSHESSFSSMNALIESCVKYSEANVAAPVGDDIGMNLLASVAAGEMSKSNVVSPVGSPQRSTPVHESTYDDNDSRVKSFPADHSTDSADEEHVKHGTSQALWAKNSDSNQAKPAGDVTGQINTSPKDLQHTGDPCQENIEKSKEIVMGEEHPVGAGKNLEEDKAGIRVDVDGSPDTKHEMSGSVLAEDKVSESTLGAETEAVNEGLNSSMQIEQKPPPITTYGEFVKGTDGEALRTSGVGQDMPSEHIDVVKAEKADEVDTKSHVIHSEEKKSVWKSNAAMIHEDQIVPHVVSTVNEGKGEHMEEDLEGNEAQEQCSAGPGPPEASTTLRMQETGQHLRTGAPKLIASEGDKAQESTSTTIDASFSAAGVSDVEAKVEFDLNEGFNGDDGKYGESSNFTAPGCSGSVLPLISPLPLSVSSVSSSLPASITVAAAAKGPFVPPEDLLRSKGALGWKGSAATSAFRPAEPRKIFEMPLGATNISISDAPPGKHSRPPLDIDLNVPDERVLEDLASRNCARDTVSVPDLPNNRDGSRCELMGSTPVRGSGGLDLDLNRAEELIDIGNYSSSNGHKTDGPLQPGTSSGGLMNGEVSVRRDFDLNDGPVVDETSVEQSLFHQQPRNVPSQAPVSGLRISNAESGNFSSWFPRGNTYSTITVPSLLPDRGDQPFPIVAPGGPQRMLAPPSGGTPFASDVFRGPVLSSSPAVPFPSTPFQYPVFPFGTSFPLPSATFSGGSTTYVDSSSGGRLCFPAVNSQLVGPAGAVPSHYPRPYVVGLPDGSNNSSGESSWKWGRQGLDLNAGPGVSETEGRDETSPLVPRQLSVASSQVLAEEQARMYQVAGGLLKRKEPEGGWDGYKRPSWQ
ncbi:BAH domain [Melia azedarach]|uniref:BAH domain n=2 Tax=Melia azedarach TaxID=155640 RepID=A0ACC1XM21_MELAZ|nr:BAH domain [Melia azedarach]KAJ4712281.1 BAH domain [Melia azedarach]